MKKRTLSLVLALLMLLQLSPIAYAKDNHDLDFKERHTLEQIEKSLSSLAKTYPEITDLFSIGSSWQENEIWCLKITTKNKKVQIGIKMENLEMTQEQVV